MVVNLDGPCTHEITISCGLRLFNYRYLPSSDLLKGFRLDSITETDEGKACARLSTNPQMIVWRDHKQSPKD